MSDPGPDPGTQPGPDPGSEPEPAPARDRSTTTDDGPAAIRDVAAAVRDEPPVLPRVTRDEAGEGWGERPSPDDDDFYLRERPPHHEG